MKSYTLIQSINRHQLTELLRNSANSGTQIADHFFTNFPYLQHLVNQNYSSALNQGLELLTDCKVIDTNAYESIHKGTPFYWLGMAAYLVNDFTTATYYFDAALSEDIRAGASLNNPTPAMLFILIEGDDKSQAAKKLTKNLQLILEDSLRKYNYSYNLHLNTQKLTLKDLRNNFLGISMSQQTQLLRTIATAFISYYLEFNYYKILIDIRPTGYITSEPFYTHLFKGCLIFESLLKSNRKNPITNNGTTLSTNLNQLRNELGIPHGLSIGGLTFPDIVTQVSSASNNIETAITYTGRIRNTLGHNLGWGVNLNKDQYSQLFYFISISCLHTIATLYR